MKKITILNGHPNPGSFCESLAESYLKGALETGANCTLLHLYNLRFDPILHHGFARRTELEPDLLHAQQLIAQSDHLVWVYPTWWGTHPALLKGFIDRTFLPGFAFKYCENSPLWDKLLLGKSARLLVTMDSPRWYNYLIYGDAGHKVMKKAILQFCGINPVKITTVAGVKNSDPSQRNKWLNRTIQLGRNQR